jgi:hypothetical protein
MEEHMKKQRCVRLAFRGQDLIDLLCGKILMVTSLPKDAKFVRFYMDGNITDGLVLNLVIHSRKFATVSEGAIIPEANAVLIERQELKLGA